MNESYKHVSTNQADDFMFHQVADRASAGWSSDRTADQHRWEISSEASFAQLRAIAAGNTTLFFQKDLYRYGFGYTNSKNSHLFGDESTAS